MKVLKKTYQDVDVKEIEARMKAKGLSLRGFARLLEVSPAYVSTLFTGKEQRVSEAFYNRMVEVLSKDLTQDKKGV